MKKDEIGFTEGLRE